VTAVLTAERPLADAVRQLPGPGVTLARQDTLQLRGLMDDAIRALHRCRLLGESARELAAAGLASHQGYGRRGALVALSPRATIDSRS